MTTCRKCTFARLTSTMKQEGTDEQLGHCWRYPPTALAPNSAAYPIVKLDVFTCGEFKKSARPMPTKPGNEERLYE